MKMKKVAIVGASGYSGEVLVQLLLNHPHAELVAVTSRQNNRTATEGNTISIIDVDLARQGLPVAEAARVRVGTDRSDAPARPFAVAWVPLRVSVEPAVEFAAWLLGRLGSGQRITVDGREMA